MQTGSERLERAQKLKVIFSIEGNFYQNIDYDYCFRNGIRVLNCGPVYGLPVAEMALEFALNVARGVHREDRRFRAGTERYLAEILARPKFAPRSRILLSGWYANLAPDTLVWHPRSIHTWTPTLTM